jgi:hypothetical protein
VGAVLSIALLMKETERHWLAFLASWEKRLERLDRPEQERVGRTFVTEDRRLGRFLLRMREGERRRPRGEVVGGIEASVREHGFQPVLVGGLYRLQGELSLLVRASVLQGLGGLVALFSLIASP